MIFPLSCLCGRGNWHTFIHCSIITQFYRYKFNLSITAVMIYVFRLNYANVIAADVLAPCIISGLVIDYAEYFLQRLTHEMRIMHGQQHLFSTAEELFLSLLWRHKGLDGVSDHQFHECSLNRLSKRRSKKTSKLRVTGLCVGNSPVTGEFPAQRASNAENVSIWWRHHENDRIIMRWIVARWYSNSRPLSFMRGAQTAKLRQRDIFQLMIRHTGSVDNDIIFCKSWNTK